MKANLSYMLVYKRVTLSNKLTDQPSGLENYFLLSVCVLRLFPLCYLSHWYQERELIPIQDN